MHHYCIPDHIKNSSTYKRVRLKHHAVNVQIENIIFYASENIISTRR